MLTATRPAICLEPLAVRTDGKIQYELKRPFRNGITGFLFSHLYFLSKLTALAYPSVATSLDTVAYWRGAAFTLMHVEDTDSSLKM